MTDLRRDVVTFGCAISAGIHAGLAPDHFEESAAAGMGFALSALALGVLAVALARSSRRLYLDAAIVVLAGLLVAYLFAVTTGVPGLVPEPEPVDWLAVATKVVEAIALAAALSLRVSLPLLRPIPVALVALVAACGAVLAVAVSPGHHAHSHEPGHHHHSNG